MASSSEQRLGWQVVDYGPAEARHRVLCLPGALCTAPFFDDLASDPSLRDAGMRMFATTLPGYGDSPPIDDFTVEGYAAGAARLAADLGCTAVVGHSVGANVAIEMAASGAFEGPLLLLSPSFSREDESRVPRALDRLGRVLGTLPFRAMLGVIGPAMGGEFPEERREALVAEIKKNRPAFVRAQLHAYLAYLDHHGSVSTRLRDSGARACVVFGESDDVGITAEERAEIEGCSSTSLAVIDGAGHMALNQKPARVAALLSETVAG